MINKIKQIWRYIVIGAFIALITIIVILYNSYQNSQESLKESRNNEKAYQIENLNLKDDSRMFMFHIEQLSYYNDSITEKLNAERKNLKIKDNQIVQLQYMLSKVQKVDTITLVDTIFTPTVDLDTTIGDKWYSLNLKLKYPSSIIVAPTFTSEKMVFMYLKKETINPPKKTWFGRLFQKKHKVMEVKVVESSPYIENKQTRFIEIVK